MRVVRQGCGLCRESATFKTHHPARAERQAREWAERHKRDCEGQRPSRLPHASSRAVSDRGDA